MQSEKRKWKPRALAALASSTAAVILWPGSRAMGAPDNWIDGSDNWNTPADWSTGVPGNGADANIVDTDGVSRTITYNYAGAGVTLNSLTLDLTGGTSVQSNILSQSANTLSSTTETVGNSGSGIFNQSGGTNSIGSALFVGSNSGSTGTYILSGNGTLSDSLFENIGQSGVGVFNQTGGSNTANGEIGQYGGISVGENAGSVGTYYLSGASSVINAPAGEGAGIYGTGTFVQTGGVNNSAGFSLGVWAGSSGTYNLGGGSFIDNSGSQGLYIGGSIHTGGTGIFNLSAGTLAVSSSISVFNTPGSNFNQTGGSASTGTMNVYSAAEIQGGFFTAGTLNVDTGGGISLGSTSTFYAPTFENIGVSGVGLFNQSGGTNTAIGQINAFGGLSVGVNSGSNGTYLLGGASSVLNTPAGEGVGVGGTGTFTQTGGTNNSDGMSLGVSSNSFGTYNLSGGSFINRSVSQGVFIGGSVRPGGRGVFNVSGNGTLSAVSTFIEIFNTNGSILNQSGGLITAASLNDSRSFNQSGGTAALFQITGTGQISLTGGITTLALGGTASQIGSLSAGGTSTLDMQLGGYTQGVTYDLLHVTGSTSLGGTLQVDLVNGFVPLVGDQFTILTSATTITGAFAGLTTADSPFFTYSVSYGAQHNFVELTVTSIPEPASLSLFALAGTLSLRRRKQPKRSARHSPIGAA